MEACLSAHFVARTLRRLGHEPRIIPAKYAKPFMKGQKNDYNDAEAIAEAALRPNLRVVREKTQDELDLQAYHRIRSRLVSRRTATVNQIRAFLIEQGIAIRPGLRALRTSLFDILKNRADEISPHMSDLIVGLYEDWTEEADDRFLDLRNEPADPRRQFDRTLRLRRLAKLEKMGLATEHAPGVWEMSERMEPTLRDMDERGDIIRNMHKALKADGLERDPMTFQIHDTAPEIPIVGRVVDKYLSDELGESLTVVVDGIDGRTHHVAGIDAARITEARIGSVIEVGPPDIAQRPSDRAIAAIAEGGIYLPSRHLEQAKFEGRVPGGDYEGFVDAHVRRLEALRRAGIAERIDADQLRIPEDFENRAAAYDAGRNRQASVRVLSTFDLEKQIGADGSTWLDRRLLSSEPSDLSPSGFGQQVADAMDRRREHHIDQGDATRKPDGRIFYRRNLLGTLREREVASAGAEMAASKNLPFRAAADGERVSGKFTGTVQLSSGKFAIVEKSQEFTLVPWRPVIDRHLGREVAGIMQGGSMSWQLARQRMIAIGI